MRELMNQLQNRKNVLKRAITKAEREARSFPEGHLRVSCTRGRSRYYKVDSSSQPSGRYLSVNEDLLVTSLAQKAYNERFLSAAREELQVILKFTARLEKLDSERVYQEQSAARKEFVKPYIIPEDEYIRAWLEESYISNPYNEDDKRFDTKKGDKVRSKSEAIIADMLYELGIPYRYEQVVSLSSGALRYPDFTILNIKAREEVYLEHLGMMDLDDYREGNLGKIDEYRASGIYIGKNLLLTFESPSHPLDIKGIRKMFIEMFC